MQQKSKLARMNNGTNVDKVEKQPKSKEQTAAQALLA
jgi:hypothetical protein